MADYAIQRRMMVDGQIRTADVTDRSILQAMLEIPRERFLPPEQAQLAYLDLDLPVGQGGRRLLRPMVLAKMLQALEVSAEDTVLDVGCAGGYAAAVLASLSKAVFALEEEPRLAAHAKGALADLPNVKVVEGKLTDGYAAQAPYDAILLEGATEQEPEALCRQLADRGRLVCISGDGPAAKVVVFRRDGEDVTPRVVFDAAGTVLPGFAKPRVFSF